jgi:hypothetical protein
LPYYDDFGSNQGWNLWSADHGSVSLAGGRYRMTILAPGLFFWESHPELNVSDLDLEVDAYLDPQTEHAVTLGVVFRHNAEAGGYIFGISNYGEYELKAVQPGEWAALVDFTPHQAINRTGLNTLGVQMVGSTMRLFINGTQVNQVSDERFSSGQVGFYASTIGGGEQAILEFDNLSVESLGSLR